MSESLPTEIIAVALACVLLGGCVKSDPELPDTRAVERIPTPTIRYETNNAWVYEVQLQDGTRCAYLSGSGGIDCDWRGKNHVER